MARTYLNLFDIDSFYKRMTVEINTSTVPVDERDTKASLKKSNKPKKNKKHKNSKSKKAKRHKCTTWNISNDPTLCCESIISIDDKFIDMPKEETIILDEDTKYCSKFNFKPLQVSELPINIVIKDKTYRVKDIEVDDWDKSVVDVIVKYQKMNMLLIYLTTNEYNSKAIDIEYYIKTNKLENLLIEV